MQARVLPLVRVCIVVAIVAAAIWQSFADRPVAENVAPAPAIAEKPAPAQCGDEPAEHSRASREEGSAARRIGHVTLRDESGHVVYEGPVDLSATIERIESGRRLDHFSHDGIVFHNREGHLPRQPSGYYHEYVQPTPHEHGPGPQRVIVGKSGDIWYTPDHYRTFRRIK